VYVSDKNIPTCVETEDKDAFREWLAERITISEKGSNLEYVLRKYDELHAPQPAPQEPKPLFEVGETIQTKTLELKLIVKHRYFENGEWIYDLKSPNGMIFEHNRESILRKLPKTKLVFSLEEWVNDRYKTYGASKIIKFIDLFRPFDGKEKKEIPPVLEILDVHFVEVEVK